MRLVITFPTQAPPIQSGVEHGIVATAGGQLGAYVLTAETSIVETTAFSTGVRLSFYGNRQRQRVRNLGTNTLLLYPPVDGTSIAYRFAGMDAGEPLPILPGNDAAATYAGEGEWTVDNSGWLLASENLADVANAAAAWANLGGGTTGQTDIGAGLTETDGVLSADVRSVAGRTGAVVLTYNDVGGLGTSATRDVGVTAGTVAAGDDARVVGAVQQSTVAQPNGIASLDAGGRLQPAQVPGGFTEALIWQGFWNAATNTPTLVSGVGTTGHVWGVSVGGTTNLDGETGWVLGDQAVFNGSEWERFPLSNSNGTMAVQDADNIAVVGGYATGLTTLGLASGLTFDEDLAPDFKWSVSINSAVVVAIDWSGRFYAMNATIAALTVTASLVVASVTPLVLTVGGWSVSEADSLVPDSLYPVFAGDHMLARFDPDGAQSIGYLRAKRIDINGLPVLPASDAGPTNAVMVTDAAYGAVGDAVRFLGRATVAAGSQTTINLSLYAGEITLAQLNSTTAQVSIVPVLNEGIAFQPYMVGMRMHLQVGAYELVAIVSKWRSDAILEVTAADVTLLLAETGSILIPAPSQQDVGKILVIEGMGQPRWLANNMTNVTVYTPPTGRLAFMATITEVPSATSIKVGTTIPYLIDDMPVDVKWGTNDSEALARAGQAAWDAGLKALHFPGGAYRAFLAPGFVGAGSPRQDYVVRCETDPGAALNGTVWTSDGAQVWTYDEGGLAIDKQAAPLGSPSPGMIDKKIHGPQSFPRCANLSQVIWLGTGDSMATKNPSFQGGAWEPAVALFAAFVAANPRKVVTEYNVAVGGSTAESASSDTYTFANGTGSTRYWVVPRPIVGTHSLLAYIQDPNKTGVGSPIRADVVHLGISGFNDSWGMSVDAVHQLINTIRSIPHADAFGPTDIIMHTDRIGLTHITNVGNGAGVALPDPLTHTAGNEYGSMLLETTAGVLGLPCFDLFTLTTRAMFGNDPRRMAYRSAPAFSADVGPTAPLQIPFAVRDVSFLMSLPGANDAAEWAAAGQIDLQISPNPGNRLMMRYGPNGNLWVGVATNGEIITTTCTIAAGGTTLTVAAPTTFSGVTISSRDSIPQLYVASDVFTGGMARQCIIAPTGYEFREQRNVIEAVLGPRDVWLYDHTAVKASITNSTGRTVTVGGQHFKSTDGRSLPDVTLFYPDGTIFNSQVASYTSQTQVVLAHPAPQALAAAAVPMHLGRMSVKWFDTGINLSGLTTTTNFIDVEVARGSLLIGYQDADGNPSTLPIMRKIERFGGSFQPVLRAQADTTIAVSRLFIGDVPTCYMPTIVPWDMRGIPGTADGYWLGGQGGHPATTVQPHVLDPLLANVNLST